VLVPPDTAPTMRSPLLHHPTPTSESKYKYLFLGGCCLVALLLSIAVINAWLTFDWRNVKPTLTYGNDGGVILFGK
jgi:hypothetical protein